MLGVIEDGLFQISEHFQNSHCDSGEEKDNQYPITLRWDLKPSYYRS